MKINDVLRMLWKDPMEDNYYILRKKFGQIKPLSGFDNDHPCIFVLSTGRAGTQTLSALFDLSSGFNVYHEPAPKLYRLGKSCYEMNATGELDQVFVEAFSLARDSLLAKALNYGHGYIETSPQVTFVARIISNLIPASRFIHLVRNPKDVVRSGMRRNWFSDPQYDQNRITPGDRSSIKIDWAKATDLDKNIWLWAETNSWILNFESSISNTRFMRVHSEEIFNGHKESLEQLYKFSGKKLPSPSRLEKVLKLKLNKQVTGEFPSPEVWSTEMNDQLYSIAGSVIDRLNYSMI